MRSNRKFISLKSRIMIYTMIPVAISFLVVFSVLFYVMLNSIQGTARAEFSAIGHQYANIFKNKLDGSVNYLSILSSTLESKAGTETADRIQLQQAVLHIFDDYDLIDGSSVYFEQNMYDGRDAEFTGSEYGTERSGKICYYFYNDGGATAYLPEALENEIEFELPHYTEAKEANEPIYTKPAVHEVDGRNIPMFTLTHPVKDKVGAFIGAVTVDLFLEDIYEQLQNEKIYETGYIVITNDKGEVICGPIFEDVGKTREEAGFDFALPSSDGEAAYSNAASVINGKNCFVTTVAFYIPQLDSSFYVSVAAPQSEIYADAIRLVITLIAFNTIFILAVGCLMYYLIGKISNPIKLITENANKIAEGNIACAMEFDIFSEETKTIDEVYILFIAIKKMLSQLDEMQKIRVESLELKHEKEKAEAEARAKSDFLAKMSHEIRTPMNAIMGMSELILRKDLEQDVYENALGIKSASTNLLSIINDILDFSKIESGMLEIIEANYHFASLVNDVIGIIRMRLMEKPILFSVYIDSSIPASLTGDEVRIRQILLNLLSNAVKYTDEGSISFEATCVLRDNTAELEINISDSGIGIRKEDISSLFGDFVQVDLAKNKGVEGTGLGLAISRSLCRAMGGDITMQSEYGKGSTFTVTLTQKFEEYTPFASVLNPEEKSVLLYETREVYADSVLRSLENLGVTCKSARNIASLFDDLERYPYLFVASFCYGSVKPALAKLAKPPRMVLLADVSETFATKDARMLTMPAHTLSIANIFNDVYDNSSRPTETGISFTAPSARILIVDDIGANLKVAEGLMAPYEMRIDVCKSGREAIQAVAVSQYDLVFMDHMMPEMDGIEATGRIRAMQGDYFRDLPIVALTANAVSGIREMFIQNGMDDFLAKPIETRKLDAILDKWIPKEKREKPSEEKPEENESSEFISMLRAVPELSVDKALSLVGGSASAYERIVTLSVRLLPENMARLNELLETETSLYAIEAHGIKGVLNNIGAYKLGETAFKLENLSKAGDIDACRAIHPDFTAELEKFMEAMLPIIDVPADTDKPRGDKAQILNALPAIEEAAEFFDSALALEILAPIIEYTYSRHVDEALTDMTLALERFDFDDTALYMEKLKDALNSDV